METTADHPVYLYLQPNPYQHPYYTHVMSWRLLGHYSFDPLRTANDRIGTSRTSQRTSAPSHHGDTSARQRPRPAGHGLRAGCTRGARSTSCRSKGRGSAGSSLRGRLGTSTSTKESTLLLDVFGQVRQLEVITGCRNGRGGNCQRAYCYKINIICLKRRAVHTKGNNPFT